MEVLDRVWEWDSRDDEGGVKHAPHGHFAEVKRRALPGGFCGLRKLSYMNEEKVQGDGEAKWINMKTPVTG